VPTRHFVAMLALILFAVPHLLAQQTSDPLSARQIDQVRELGTQPVERIKLYLKFADQRIDAIRDMSKHAQEDNRPAELRARLEEFTRITDELSENIDTYHEDHADIRKALRQVMESTSKWPDVLNSSPPDQTYDFARKTALDAATSCSEQAQGLLAKEETYFGAHKDQAGKNGKAPSPEQ
jgi:hypothetical protein